MNIDLPALLAALPKGTLPPGRLIASELGGPPLYWLSDEPAASGAWARVQEHHPSSGLWPLLLSPLSNFDTRPWVDGEVYPGDMTSPDLHEAADVLEGWWREYTSGDADPQSAAELGALTEPFGQHWPGLAPAGDPAGPPAEHADTYADVLVNGSTRLGLVPAARGADALTAIGWGGPMNYTNDTGEISAVVRTWEDRFGVRVVGVGFDTLLLSVAAPPTSPEHALHVAAEHFAFSPDNVWQGIEPLTAYAEYIRGRNSWAFWWD